MSEHLRLPLPAGLSSSAGPPFVGRAAELQRLEQAWEAVSDDDRQVVCIGGEPGVGKTRLAREAAVALHRQGAAVLWGACHADLDVPYRPLVTALDQLFDAAEPGTLASVLSGPGAGQLTRLTPKVVRHRPELPDHHSADGDSRLALFDAVVDLLVALAGRQPVVLVLEDLHWATTPTVQLLTHLVESTARARLLMVLTQRTTVPDRSDEVMHAIADIYRHDGVLRLDLTGLDTSDVADYLVHGAGVPPDRARCSAVLLRDQTGGNPFFLRELWRDLAARGGVDALRRPEFSAPPTVRDTLTRRLARLDPAHTDVIELAAVLGERVDLATLLESGDHRPETVFTAVDAAVEFGLFTVESPAPRRYRFQHALARQAVLDRMPSSRQMTRHLAVARALERLGGDDPDVVARLAHHYERAHPLGSADKAVEYLVAAAAHAARSLAHEEAGALLERAAALVTSEAPRRAELLLAAAASRMRAGDFAAARELYRRLTRSADPEVRLRAAIGHENASWRPGLQGDSSLELLEDAVRNRPPPRPDDPVHVRALASRGRALAFVGDPAAAAAVGERALDLARRSGDTDLLAHALGATLWGETTPRPDPVLRRRAAELVELGDQLGDVEHVGVGAFLGAALAYRAGDPDAWVRGRQQLLRVARTSGQAFFRYLAGCEAAAHQYASGSFDAAGRTLATVAELGREFGVDTAEGSHGMQVFMLRRATGRLGAVRGLVDGAEDPEAHWAPGLLALYVELGLWQPAARVLAFLLDRLDAHRASTATWPGVLAFLADAAVRLEDAAAAAAVQPLLAEFRGCNLLVGQFVTTFGSADRELARLGSLLGADDVETAFAAALAMDRRMGATTHQVETLTAWSRHLTDTGGPRAARRAEELAGEARALAERIGYRRASGGVGSTSAAPGRVLPDGLSEREAEVLTLIAEGLANREIGERLFISPHTAANHVRSILMKTGAANRTQAARYAADRGLLAGTAASGSPVRG